MAKKYQLHGAFPSKAGDSAYEVALKNGFKGTEQEWLASLEGPMGPQGLPGKDGKDSASGIYVGPGEIPEGYNIQIDPTGEAPVLVQSVNGVKPDENGNVEVAGGSGGGNANICNFTTTSEQEVNGITLELPTTLNKFYIIDFYIVFGEVLSQPMSLYSRQGSGCYKGHSSALPVNTKSVNIFGLRFSDVYLHIGFNSAINFAENAHPTLPYTTLLISNVNKTITFYSNTSGVNFPTGTSISVWGVYEK